ncbi:VOC family protein [Nakamurella sp. GG22]
MSSKLQTVIYPVRDLDSAKALFSGLLGEQPVMDQPYYVQFSVGGLELGLDPHGHQKGMTGPVSYWTVSDIKQSLAALVEAGAEEVQGVSDVGGGRLIASVKDSDGNVIGLMQQG